MKKNLLVLVIILLIWFIVNSCGGDEETQKCSCVYKVHGTEDLCCGISNCCEIDAFNGKTMANGTKIILEDSVSVNSAAVETKINAVFQDMIDNDVGAHATFAKNNIKIIYILPSGRGVNIVKENGVGIAKIGVNAINSIDHSLIGGPFYDFAVANMAAALFKQMDYSKNTVRMAFGKVMGQRMI